MNLKSDIAIGEPQLVLKALNLSGKEGVNAVIAKRGEMETALMPWLNLASWFSGHFQSFQVRDETDSVFLPLTDLHCLQEREEETEELVPNQYVIK